MTQAPEVARLDVNLDLIEEAPAWSWECVYCGVEAETPVTREEAVAGAERHFEGRPA